MVVWSGDGAALGIVNFDNGPHEDSQRKIIRNRRRKEALLPFEPVPPVDQVITDLMWSQFPFPASLPKASTLLLIKDLLNLALNLFNKLAFIALCEFQRLMTL